MWLAHVFGQRGTKNKIKLTKAETLAKKQNFLKKETEQKQGLWRKKRKKKTKKQRRRKGLRPPVSQSNLFPLHHRWLKRQSITSFYPFFVCFHFLVRLQHGVFQRFHPIWPIRPESAQICPSLSRVSASHGKKYIYIHTWQDAAQLSGSGVPRASLRWTQVRLIWRRVRASQLLNSSSGKEHHIFGRKQMLMLLG